MWNDGLLGGHVHLSHCHTASTARRGEFGYPLYREHVTSPCLHTPPDRRMNCTETIVTERSRCAQPNATIAAHVRTGVDAHNTFYGKGASCQLPGVVRPQNCAALAWPITRVWAHFLFPARTCYRRKARLNCLTCNRARTCRPRRSWAVGGWCCNPR